MAKTVKLGIISCILLWNAMVISQKTSSNALSEITPGAVTSSLPSEKPTPAPISEPETTQHSTTPTHCGPPPNITNSDYSPKTTTTYGAEVTYTCNEGYNKSGTSKIRCNNNGNWTPKDFSCTLIDCGPPPNITNSDYSPKTTTTYGAEVTYTCNEGYNKSGTSKIRCGNNGTWTPKDFNCTLIDCGPPPNITNSDYSPKTTTTYGAEVTYTCNEGYNKIGTSKIRCNNNGTWTPKDFSCFLIDCGPPPNITNSDYSPKTTTTYGAEVTYTCNEGYNKSGTSKIRCNNNGTWTPKDFSCTLIDCGPPPNITNSDYSPKTTTTYGAEVTYTCDTGYNKSGTSEIRCGNNGTWTPKEFGCTLIDCGPPPNITNSDYSPKTTTTYGAEVTYTCNEGYNTSGTSKIRCNNNGTWTPKDFNCTLIESIVGANCKVNEQCITRNASCKNGTCSCDGYLYYAENECRVRPVISGVLVIASVETQVFSVLWDKLNLTEEQPHIYVTAKNGTQQKCNTLSTIGCNFLGLEPGSEYFISFKITDVNGVPSHPVNLSTYTKPNPPPQPATIVRWESNVTLTWNDGQQHNCEFYDISISPVPTKGNDSIRIPNEEKLSTITFDNLVGGTFYTVTILAVAGKYNASTMVSMYTRPISPYNATLLGQTDSTLNISAVYDGENEALIQYRIHIEPPLTSNDEQSLDNSYSVQFANTSIFAVNGLKSGTLYNLTIYSWLDELESETATYISNYTRPKGPTKPSIGNITSTGFIVSFSDNGNFDLFTVQFCLHSDITCPEVTNTTEENYVASNLTAGTNYKVIVNTILHNGLESLDKKSVLSYTRPNGLLNISVPVENIHERNATINITSKDNLFNYTVVKLYNNTGELSNTFNTTTITKLTPGTKYNIEVFTATITGLESSEHLTLEFNTRPPTPSVGIPIERGLDSITFNLSGNYGSFDHFDITDEIGKLITTVSSTGNKKFIAHNLTAGTHFAYKVYTNYSMLRSDGYVQIMAYTQPDQIGNMTITDITSSSMHVTWGAPMFGDVTAYQSTIICLGPNDNSAIKTFHHTSRSLTAATTGLEPGSICNVSVTTQINDTNEIVLGNATTDTFVNCTIESAPGEVQNLSITHNTSNSITIEWNRPSERNGIIDEYEINVLQNNSSVQTYILNCTRCILAAKENDLSTIAQRCANASVCDSADSDKGFSYNITGLHPFRTYNISVLVKTSLVGIETWASNCTTDESAPNGPPSISSNTTTATEIEIKWSPPEYGYRNGIITKYKISYTFENKTCFDDANGDNITKHELYENDSTAQTLNGLVPYTDHYVRIQAFTRVGEGPFSDAVTISTKQSRPSEVRGLNATAITNQSISLSWSQPCRPNGEITNYTIYLTNDDQNAPQNMTSSINGFDIRDNILPYSNYTITVAGNTVIGEGNRTEGIQVTTSVGVPKIPRNVGARNVSSTILNITWATPLLYTGPTYYTITVKDAIDPSIEISTNVTGFHAKTTIIEGLDQYWWYNITVMAVTEVGQTQSESIHRRTDEDVPEDVKGLHVISEEDVTKPRTIKVSWNLLTDKQKNGVLKSYYVRYSSPGTDKSITLKPSASEYVIKDIDPGNYTIKVYASTEKGKGNDSSQLITLPAGAPLKVPEPPGRPLIRKASIAVDNDETQIAIELPLESFLCNTSNGEPKEWGIIVSEEAAANDESFFGNKTAFDSRKNTVYARWDNAKDINPMPAYIATTPGEYDPCNTKGNRKKRSTSQSSQGSFTVGIDGKCSGVKDNYCNGELPPDRSFRVKSYVCTDGGCTETKYSQPIKTVPLKAPNPTIPIAAGVSSAVVVIIVLIVVATLKRKQIACFKKDIESSSTHRPGDGIEFDRMESTKKRPFTPGPTKLCDFPDRVEVMHRDSDLIFADAFKLLREKSPTHPMTASEAQCSRPKNRYTNILPFDHSRVKLRPSDDVEGSDYINANYIPGYTSRREYIATQGPMLATFDDFWRMVWEQNVDTIVMLTRLTENGRHKCDKYWPDLSDPVYYGDLVVTVSSESNLSDYTIRIMEIKSKGVAKKVHQFCYLKWPDMGCPETPYLLLELVKNVRNYTKRERQDKSSGPVVVHCSAGVGRTGTFIAVDTLLQHIRDHDEVDIFSLVLEMRNQRLNMVQTEDQFVYIHECVNAFISTDEDDPEDDEEPVYVNTMESGENVYENTAFNADH